MNLYIFTFEPQPPCKMYIFCVFEYASLNLLAIIPVEVISYRHRSHRYDPSWCISFKLALSFPVDPILAYLSIIVRRAGLLWSQQDFEWRWSVPLFKCLTVLEFSFILFDLCLLITLFNSIMNYVPIVTFWIFTYHKIWILSIMFCCIWNYLLIYFLACLEVSWRVVS